MLAVVALLPLPLCSLPPYRVRAVQWRVQCWLLRAPVLAGALRHPARHLPRCVCGWGGGWRGTVLREGSPRGGSTMNTAHSLLTPIRLCTCPQPPPPSPPMVCAGSTHTLSHPPRPHPAPPRRSCRGTRCRRRYGSGGSTCRRRRYSDDARRSGEAGGTSCRPAVICLGPAAIGHYAPAVGHPDVGGTSGGQGGGDDGGDGLVRRHHQDPDCGPGRRRCCTACFHSRTAYRGFGTRSLRSTVVARPAAGVGRGRRYGRRYNARRGRRRSGRGRPYGSGAAGCTQGAH